MDADDAVWLRRAVELATVNVRHGGGPFGAVIVRGDALVSTGQNRVTLDTDPTAHAEVVAIRSAAGVLRNFSLAGCTLYASCEPCPLCMAAALWARLDRVVYAADRTDAARGGFDDQEFYELFDEAARQLADRDRTAGAAGRHSTVRGVAGRHRPGGLLSPEVWYVSYGSNMSRERLAAYLEGGRPRGARASYVGARDPSPPAADIAVELPGRLYFAGESSIWGGGVAFYDHDESGPTAARAYRITAAQFADVAAQEMHRLPQAGDPIEQIVIDGMTDGAACGRPRSLRDADRGGSP